MSPPLHLNKVVQAYGEHYGRIFNKAFMQFSCGDQERTVRGSL